MIPRELIGTAQVPGGEEVYKSLACPAEVVIPPEESRDIQARFVPRGQLLAEYRKAVESRIAALTKR